MKKFRYLVIGSFNSNCGRTHTTFNSILEWDKVHINGLINAIKGEFIERFPDMEIPMISNMIEVGYPEKEDN